MRTFFKRKKMQEWNAYMDGKVLPIEQVTDEIFPKKCWEMVL